MLSRGFVRRLLVSLTLVQIATPAFTQANDLLRASVESLRETRSVYLDGTALESGRLLADFYGNRGYTPAWNRTSQVQALLQAAESSTEHGLVPEDFNLGGLRAFAKPGALHALSPAKRISAELRLSDALLRYVHHIRFGRLNPASVNPAWNHRPAVPAATLIADMESVVGSRDPTARLSALAPRPFYYEALRRTLNTVAAAHERRPKPPIPNGEPLVLGMRDPRVAQLREHLSLLGDIPNASPTSSGGPGADPEMYDADLFKAVVAFQRRLGLTADGVVGPASIAALNRPGGTASLDKIRINLERMRWFYDDLPGDYVLVDVAGFMAHVVRDGAVDWSTRVVVGTAEQQTPSFRDEMDHVVFNPTWTVPPSIQKKMRGVSSRYKVVDRRTGRTVSGGNLSDHRRYRLVQAAGPGNALGQVKFMFPNGHAIYLHDTPSKGLFSHGTRTYSHGCVRVQHPLKLAEVILGEQGWNQSSIRQAVDSNKTRYVTLDEHLPVILYYLTAMTDAEGRLNLRRDVYDRDKALLSAYAGPASPIRIAYPKPAPAAAPTPRTPPPAGSGAQAPGQQPPAAAPRPGATLTLEVPKGMEQGQPQIRDNAAPKARVSLEGSPVSSL